MHLWRWSHTATSSSDAFKKLFENLANKLDIQYDYERWQKSPNERRDYRQTLECLRYHLDNSDFPKILEIGCGVGTWTVHLCNCCENITVLDICSKFAELTVNCITQLNIARVSKIVGDFQDPHTKISGRYDAIISIRAIEYMENKAFVLSRMYNLLNEGGIIFVVTKNPYSARAARSLIPFLSVLKAKIGFKNPWWALRYMIHYQNLAAKTQKAGFKNINIYPVIISIICPPSECMRRYALPLSNMIFRSTYKKRLNPLFLPVIESYCIIAQKPITSRRSAKRPKSPPIHSVLFHPKSSSQNHPQAANQPCKVPIS